MRIGIALLLLGVASPAAATYSIAAADPFNGEVGGAGASCVRTTSIYQIYVGVPRRGVIQAQALLGASYRFDDAAVLLVDRVEPGEILRRLTEPDYDSQFTRRQYGAVDLMGRSAGYTGIDTIDYADDVQGTRDGYVYSIQGNILTGPEVLTAMESEFEGCDLAARLMASLEAGGTDGIGDNRCTPNGIPADGAFVQVDRPDQPGWLSIRFENTAPENPVVLVREAFDAWRIRNPCPAMSEDAGVPDAAVSDAGVDASPQPDASAADAGIDADTGSGGSGCSAAQGSLLWPMLLVLWRRR